MRLRDGVGALARKSAFACTDATATSLDDCVACARTVMAQMRGGWLRILGAPDYRAYLAHHAANHDGTNPLSERDFVAVYMARRYGAGAQRCC